MENTDIQKQNLFFHTHDLLSLCDLYHRSGQMCPAPGLERAASFIILQHSIFINWTGQRIINYPQLYLYRIGFSTLLDCRLWNEKVDFWFRVFLTLLLLLLVWYKQRWSHSWQKRSCPWHQSGALVTTGFTVPCSLSGSKSVSWFRW